MYGMNNSGKLFDDELTELLLDSGFRCLYTISMHHMEQKLLLYLMLTTMSIGILLKLPENGFWIL